MFAQNTDELVYVFRSEVDDLTAPYLWPTAAVYGYMTEAFDMLLKRAGVVQQLLRLPFTAGVAVLPLPQKVLHIREARVVGGSRIDPANANTVSYTSGDDYGAPHAGPSLLFEGVGTPVAYVRDYDAKAIHLVPSPNVSGEVELQCSMTLSSPFDAGDPLPSTDAEDIRLVLHYMKSVAYQKHDAETEDLKRAKTYRELFEFGAIERAARLNNYRRAPGVVRMEYP